jgi:hypothetical protein
MEHLVVEITRVKQLEVHQIHKPAKEN